MYTFKYFDIHTNDCSINNSLELLIQNNIMRSGPSLLDMYTRGFVVHEGIVFCV